MISQGYQIKGHIFKKDQQPSVLAKNRGLHRKPVETVIVWTKMWSNSYGSTEFDQNRGKIWTQHASKNLKKVLFWSFLA